MRAGLFFLTFGALAVAATPAHCGEPPKFDEVFLTQMAKADLLYVVLYDGDASGRNLDKLVVQFAKPALVEAAKHKFKGTTKPGEQHQREGLIVFAVRMKGGGSAYYYTSPFSVEQLQEIVAAGPKKGRERASEHNWTAEELPRKK